jgi:Cdc6-like AAA superfamily ATPase
MPDNPFSCFCVETLTIEELRSVRVDRTDETTRCIKALVERRHNVLMYGSRGVGKSFLLRIIDDELKQNHPSLFPVYVRLSGLGCYGNEDVAASFSRAVLLQVCCEAWTRLLGKRYLDLRERIDETVDELKLREESEITVQRIYDALMTSGRKSRKKEVASFGMSSDFKGEKKEEAEYERQQSDVLPFEFAEFVSELTTYVLAPHNKARLLILCDEANHMPMFAQQEILERYFELFNSKQVQFLFVAGIAHWEDSPSLPTCFGTQFELEGFSSSKYVSDLIEKAKSPILFLQESIGVLFEKYMGHPRSTLQACNEAFYLAAQSSASTVTAELVRQVCLDSRVKQSQEKNIMREQLHK